LWLFVAFSGFIFFAIFSSNNCLYYLIFLHSVYSLLFAFITTWEQSISLREETDHFSEDSSNILMMFFVLFEETLVGCSSSCGVNTNPSFYRIWTLPLDPPFIDVYYKFCIPTTTFYLGLPYTLFFLYWVPPRARGGRRLLLLNKPQRPFYAG